MFLREFFATVDDDDVAMENLYFNVIVFSIAVVMLFINLTKLTIIGKKVGK